MKRCFKCERELDLSEFYVHPRMADGHLNKCKHCTRFDNNANRQAKMDYYQAYDRDRFKNDSNRRRAQRATAAALARKYPDRRKARTAVSNAIRDGRLTRHPCEECGMKAEAHHDDYSRPLDVRWLCKRHHEEAHHSLPF